MAHVIGKPPIMALCCLLVVVLSAVYPVAAIQAGEQASLATGTTAAGAVTSGACSGSDISIKQSPSGSTGAGISEFKVEILNNCKCAASNIHVNCGQFASAEPLNADTFKRLADNDCLVNGGKAVPHGTLIAFTYANTLMYPISFKSATFC